MMNAAIEARQRAQTTIAARPATMLEAVALVTLTAGYGWIAGNFSQPNSTIGFQVFITIVHALPVVLFGVAGVRLVVLGWTTGRRLMVNILCAIAVVGLAVITAFGIANPDPNSFGPHNFADYTPVAIVMAGIVTWVASQIRRPAA
jgi:hypothetical protein